MDPSKAAKKPFNKAAYRKKKYDKKSKVEEWQNKRKSYMTHKYKKIKKKEGPGLDVSKLYESENTERKENIHGEVKQDSRHSVSKPDGSKPPYKKKLSSMQKAKLQFDKKKAENDRKQAEFLNRQKQKEEKLKIYKEKKEKRFRAISAKTKKGQPLMGGRMELLLQKIQESM